MTTSPQIKSAFVSAPSTVSLDVVKAELLKRGVEPVTANEIPVSAQSALEGVRRSIEDADLVIAIVPAGKSEEESERLHPNVFFEIGLAYGLTKSVLILVAPGAKPLPSDIAGQLYLRADASNREAIGFALDQLLASKAHKARTRTPSKSDERPLRNRVEDYLNRLNERGRELRGHELEELVVDALRASGVTAVHPQGFDEGADIAVWSDDLQAIVGNPLIVEVKSRIRSQHDLRSAIEQVDMYRRRSNSQWALLVTSSLPAGVGTNRVSDIGGAVLFLTIPDLLEKLRKQSFSDIVRELRNARMHGSRT